jgi:hypothetical protein
MGTEKCASRPNRNEPGKRVYRNVRHSGGDSGGGQPDSSGRREALKAERCTLKAES